METVLSTRLPRENTLFNIPQSIIVKEKVIAFCYIATWFPDDLALFSPSFVAELNTVHMALNKKALRELRRADQ